MNKTWLEKMGDKMAIKHEVHRSDGTHEESCEFLDYDLVGKFITENLTSLTLHESFQLAPPVENIRISV